MLMQGSLCFHSLSWQIFRVQNLTPKLFRYASQFDLLAPKSHCSHLVLIIDPLVMLDPSFFPFPPPQVKQMIGYAVGEVIQSDEEVQEEGEGQGGVARWRPEGKEKCYEVVTTWVHPSYRGLNMSVQMYLMIIRQGEDKLTWRRK